MYNRFRDKQVNNALSFLSTGSNAGNTVPISGANSRGCIDSSDCASGWACNGGICRQTDNGPSGSGSSDGCGSGSSGGGGGGGGCGAGPDSYLTTDENLAGVYTSALRDLKAGDTLLIKGLNGGTVGNGLVGISLNGKCLKTGCSGTVTTLGDNDACCGQGRCCRLGASVQCFCGVCPDPPQRCDKFCTSYLAANGEPAPGCTDDNTCDECSSCVDYGNFQGTGCEKNPGAPCWCEDGGSSCSGACSKCEEDGLCRDSCENCQTCYTRLNYDCGCGTVDVKCCYSACDGTKGFHTCIPDCDALCGGGGSDPCAGSCRTVTTCTPESPPPCPPKSSCRTSGTIEAGGQTCTLTEICDKSGVPDSCGECDCNCENDCPDCKICDSSGKCVPDPGCAGYWVEIAWRKETCESCNSPIAIGGCQPRACPGTSTCPVSTWLTGSGALGEGAIGAAWVVTGQSQTSCVDNGCGNEISPSNEYTVEQADGTTMPTSTSLSPAFGCSFSTVCYRTYSFGIVVGTGDTPAEAQAAAEAKVPATGCS